MIDHDKTNGKYPRWIQVEYAVKLPYHYSFNGFSRKQIVEESMSNEIINPEIRKMDYYKGLKYLEEEYEIWLYDFSDVENWGLYKGKPVIIDFGATGKSMSKGAFK